MRSAHSTRNTRHLASQFREISPRAFQALLEHVYSNTLTSNRPTAWRLHSGRPIRKLPQTTMQEGIAKQRDRNASDRQQCGQIADVQDQPRASRTGAR